MFWRDRLHHAHGDVPTVSRETQCSPRVHFPTSGLVKRRRFGMDRVVADESEWVSWAEAAQLTGIPVHVIEWWKRKGRIEHRAGDKMRPALRRSSVEGLKARFTKFLTEVTPPHVGQCHCLRGCSWGLPLLSGLRVFASGHFLQLLARRSSPSEDGSSESWPTGASPEEEPPAGRRVDVSVARLGSSVGQHGAHREARQRLNCGVRQVFLAYLRREPGVPRVGKEPLEVSVDAVPPLRYGGDVARRLGTDPGEMVGGSTIRGLALRFRAPSLSTRRTGPYVR